MNNRRGFTMVELLGAVVILGILMMVAIPSVSSLINNSKNKYYISQKKNLESAAKSYYGNNKLILREDGDFVDVSLEELVNKKYISKMVDGTKAECVMTKPAGNNSSQEYTFVRIKKEKNRVTYTSHLYCPAYQDKKLTNGNANIGYTIEANKKTVIIKLEHLDGKVIKSYTYQLYKEDNNLVKKTLSNNSDKVSIEHDVTRFVTTQVLTLRLYIYAIDEDGHTFSVWDTVDIDDNQAPRCDDKTLEVKDEGDRFILSYSFKCYSENGCESLNNKGTLVSTKEGTKTNPYVTENIDISDSLTGYPGVCPFEFEALHRFTLKYDDNGGSGCSNNSVTRIKGDKWASNCTPTRAGYRFDGWMVDSNLVTPAALSNTAAQKHILATAKWTQLYKITYMRNTSTSDTTKKTENKAKDEAYSIANNSWTNNNKVFLGWATAQNATDSVGTWYDPAQSYTTNAELTLYAQWYDVNDLEKKYTVFIQYGDFEFVTPQQTLDTLEDKYYLYRADSTLSNYVRLGSAGFKTNGARRVMALTENGLEYRSLKAESKKTNMKTYLYALKREATTYGNEGIDARIQRLQRINDMALTYDDFRTRTFDSKLITVSSTGTYSITEKEDKNNDGVADWDIISMGGYTYVNGTGGTGSPYVAVNGFEISSNSATVSLLSVRNDKTPKVTVTPVVIEVRKKFTSRTFNPSSQKGKARYVALKALENVPTNFFPASYIKTTTTGYTGSQYIISPWDNWGTTASVSIPTGYSGKLLGVSRFVIKNAIADDSVGRSFSTPYQIVLSDMDTNCRNATAKMGVRCQNNKLTDYNGKTCEKIDWSLDFWYISYAKATVDTSAWNEKAYSIQYIMNNGPLPDKGPSVAKVDRDVNITNPSDKVVTITPNANGSGATVGSAVTENQKFGGWTSSTSAGLGSAAKSGTAANPTAAWTGSSTKNTYFRNLRSSSGLVTMTANWTPKETNLPTLTPPTGYTCKYYTAASGGTLMGSGGDSYTIPSNSPTAITAYARCSKITYTITYKRNTSSSDTTQVTESKDYGTTYSIANNSFSNTGKTFLGWANVANATDTSGTWYDPSDSYTSNSGLTLYAQWFDIESLEKAYSSYVQSGDFLQKQVVSAHNNASAGTTISSSFTAPTVSSYEEKDVSGFANSIHFRPYAMSHYGMSSRTLEDSGTAGSTSFFYLYLYKRPGSTYASDTVDKRIERLQKILDVALPKSALKEDGSCYKNNVTIGKLKEYTLTCNPPDGHEYITTSGFLLSNANPDGYNVARKYVDQNYINTSGQNVIHVSSSSDNGHQSVVQIRGYNIAYQKKSASTSTFTPSKPYGKARYVALNNLATNGHANNYFSPSDMKVADLSCGTITATEPWKDWHTYSREFTAPNDGLILGLSRLSASGGTNTTNVVIADAYKTTIGVANTAQFFIEFRAGSNSRASDSGVLFSNVDAVAAVRYISTGTMSS